MSTSAASQQTAESPVAISHRYPPPARSEPFWPPQLTVLVAILLQVLLPDRLSIGPRYLLPALEGLMLLALIIGSPQHLAAPHALRRRLTLAIVMLVSLANGISLVLLCHFLLHHQLNGDGRALVIAGVLIWLNNVIIFSLWYWEIDRGGPGRRAAGCDDLPDFLFPQMTDEVARLYPDWRPQFVDYLYLAVTNATAFSPTDTMPLNAGVKLMMGSQSLISLVTIGLVVSRAVGIL